MILLSSFLVFLIAKDPLARAQTTSTGSNPAFTNIAPCGCDLTVNQLDNNCCCDEDYNATAYESSFNCIPGPFGGNFTSQNDELCSAILSFSPDWFPLLCIQYFNSPSLGLYFYPSATSGRVGAYSYDRLVSLLATSSSLSSGSMVNAQYQTLVSGVLEPVSAALRFPQVSASGNCVRESPVRYLYDTFASCDVSVTTAICSAGTYLDAQFYTSFISVANQAPTISYLCAGVNDGAYVKQSSGIGGSETTTTPTPCAYAAPQVSGTGICQNAVAAVTYNFTWTESNISQFDIVVTLIDLNLTTSASVETSTGPDFVLAQRFSLNYVTANATDATPYSGFPGYEFGLPVISGSADSTAVTVNRTTQLLVWKPGASGTCGDTESPKFGFDRMSGCIVNTVSDCATLRADIEATQTQLLQANKVARFGNPKDNNTEEDWIDVISSVTNQSYNDVVPGQCEGIPSRAVLEFLWARTGDTNGTDVREILSAYVRFERETWVLRCTGAANCDPRIIYSEVTFTEIPPEEPTPQTSYAINRNDTCVKDATCWPELLLPLQPTFYYLYSTAVAFQLRSYNYAWAIFVTSFSIAAALIPAHWSTVGKYLKQVLPI